LTGVPAEFQRVRLPMQQHIGMPALPVVKVGDRVKVGDLVGEIIRAGMGAPVHASMSGVVRE
jgi:Na+-translocating ferredoxin:NAD+ oxidoreductase RnfC subunit